MISWLNKVDAVSSVAFVPMVRLSLLITIMSAAVYVASYVLNAIISMWVVTGTLT
jgi:hypothetical protein